MKMPGIGGVLLLFMFVSISSLATTLTTEQYLNPKKKSAAILLVAPPALGHIIPLLRLGEVLVKRGHDVGFCTTEILGVNITQESCKQYGIKFISAGLDPYTWYMLGCNIRLSWQCH